MRRSLLFTVFLFFSLVPGISHAAEPSWPSIVIGKKIAVVERPTHVTHAGDGSGRLFVTEQKGRILLVKDDARLSEPFLDIRDRVSCCGERGLLSVAFPPGYPTKRYFY
ncbi:MAG TPA: PQQ-dependent sugar dehydrogenase, partial [Nitrospirota bacterium]|nr:PQQ-dependent sugar dehydrogenase [Nitrospirota bacterium]